MKYLFIVQGEGRGHLTQAITLSAMLRRNGHEVVGVLVGKSKTRRLPEFFMREINAPVEQFESVNFLPSSSNRKANMVKSVLYNVFAFFRYFPSIRFLRDKIESSGADVVINFYELLTGFAYMSHRISVPQVCIGHQYLFLHKDFGHPHYPGALGLRLFTKMTCIGASVRLALSFREMDDDKKRRIVVVPPLLRKEVLEIRKEDVKKGDYILGYMLNAGFAEDVMNWHWKRPDIELRFFWDKWDEKPVKKVDDKLSFYLIDDVWFLRQMAGCKAYASTAGFESVCEAMYLGKPILMVPSHIEQRINAFDAMRSGAGITADSFDLTALVDFAESYEPDESFGSWVSDAEKRFLEVLEHPLA